MKVGPRSIQNLTSHITPNNLDFEKCLHQLKAKGRHVGRTSTSHTCTNKKTIKIERLLTHPICLSSFFFCLLWKASRVIFWSKKVTLHTSTFHFFEISSWKFGRSLSCYPARMRSRHSNMSQRTRTRTSITASLRNLARTQPFSHIGPTRPTAK